MTDTHDTEPDMKRSRVALDGIILHRMLDEESKELDRLYKACPDRDVAHPPNMDAMIYTVHGPHEVVEAFTGYAMSLINKYTFRLQH